MPTYEYACLSCGTHVEVYQRFNEEALTVCGVCGGPLRKVFHPAGILFKGSGFYATDSRSKGRAAGDGAAKKEPGEAGPKEPAASKGSGEPSGSKAESESGSGSGSKAGSESGSGSGSKAGSGTGTTEKSA
jgi:putative FmdB family regulatory protein